MDARPARTASATREKVTGAATQANLQLDSPTKPASGIPTIQAIGGPSKATASTRERSAGIVQSATAAIAAVYESPTPIPTPSCANAITAKLGAAALIAEETTSATRPTPSSSRRPTRDASKPATSAVNPADSPDTVRSCPAVAVETSRSEASAGSTGVRTRIAACEAARQRRSVAATARRESGIR